MGCFQGSSTRPRTVIPAAGRRSRRAADELDKPRKWGFLTIPLPIHTRELTAPTLPPQRRQEVRVRRLLLAWIPRTIGEQQRPMAIAVEPDQRQTVQRQPQRRRPLDRAGVRFDGSSRPIICLALKCMTSTLQRAA